MTESELGKQKRILQVSLSSLNRNSYHCWLRVAGPQQSLSVSWFLYVLTNTSCSLAGTKRSMGWNRLYADVELSSSFWGLQTSRICWFDTTNGAHSQTKNSDLLTTPRLAARLCQIYHELHVPSRLKLIRQATRRMHSSVSVRHHRLAVKHSTPEINFSVHCKHMITQKTSSI